MKLQIFCATAITFTSWGCEGLLDEQAAGTLSQGSGEARLTTYLVGVTMADSTHKANTRDVNLGIYRDGAGNPTCVGVDGFGQQQYYVRLEKRGSGQWQIGDQVGGNYDRYQRANSAVPLDITLHWTIERSDINKNALTNAHGRLEYLAANLSNTKLYEYHNDADGKSGFASGELLSSPNDIFDAGCGG